MTLPTDQEAIAQRVAEIVLERLGRPTAQVLTVSEAQDYVGKDSASAFYRWCHRWSVEACSQGRYARRVLDRALEREAGPGGRRAA